MFDSVSSARSFFLFFLFIYFRGAFDVVLTPNSIQCITVLHCHYLFIFFHTPNSNWPPYLLVSDGQSNRLPICCPDSSATPNHMPPITANYLGCRLSSQKKIKKTIPYESQVSLILQGFLFFFVCVRGKLARTHRGLLAWFVVLVADVVIGLQ